MHAACQAAVGGESVSGVRIRRSAEKLVIAFSKIGDRRVPRGRIASGRPFEEAGTAEAMVELGREWYRSAREA